MLDKLKKAFSLPDLRKKLLFTFAILIIYRIISQIPLPNIDRSALESFFGSNQLLGLLDIFSGGALSRFSIGFMGVGPYITSSIIMQLLTYVVPSLEALQKEGEQGQQTINQYTRLLTVPLALIQGFGLITLLQRQGVLGSLSPADMALALIITAGATIFLMWLGELISEQGIGNGISLIITAGILAGMPVQAGQTYQLIVGGGIVDSTKLFGALAFIVILVITVAFIVFINDAVRRIPISYARRVVGRKSLGGVDSYLPLKVNTAGVIPIIFALSVIVFPGLIAKFLTNARSETIRSIAESVAAAMHPQSLTYGIIYFILVVLFTFFYTSIIFKPDHVSENLQKQGGFIPGIRPGKETAGFLQYIIMRITFPGAVFLGIIAILPFIVQRITGITTLILGGTGILIIVSVVLETVSQINAFMLTKEYENYGT